MCLHPGVVRTELRDEYMQQAKPIIKILFRLIYPLFFLLTKNIYYGCQTSVYLTVEKHENLVKGGYYADCKLTKSSSESESNEVASKLWVLSEQLVKLD